MSEHVAKYVHETIQKMGDIESVLVDPRDHTHNETIPTWVDDERAKPWRDITAKADGFIVVFPEYNHGYPGELKLLWDMAYDEYNGKPVVMVGVSAGGLGGARGIENFIPVLVACGMTVLKGMNVSRVKEFAEMSDGDKAEKYDEKVEKMVGAMKEFLKK